MDGNAVDMQRISRAIAVALMALVSASAGVALQADPASADAVGDFYSGWWDEPIVRAAPGLLGNDTGLPPNPVVVVTHQPVHGGAVVVANDGSFTYTPPLLIGHGLNEDFFYCVADASSPTDCVTSEADVNINLNYPAASGDQYTTLYGTALVKAAPGVMTNDGWRSGMGVLLLSPPAHGGALNLAGDGSFTYTPPLGFVGEDTFHYCVVAVPNTPPCFAEAQAGANDATVTISIPPPTAIADAYTSDPSGLAVPAPGVLGNDVAVPVGASLLVTEDVANGSLTTAADGSFQYIPAPGSFGTDAFTYCLSETYAAGPCISPDTTVVINVVAPSVGDDAWAVYPGYPIGVPAPGVLANDVVPSLTGANVVGPPSQAQSWSLGRDGAVTYQAAAGFTGTDTLTYCLTSDTAPSGPCMSRIATVTFSVAEPVAVKDDYSTPALTQLTVAAPGVFSNDSGLSPGSVPNLLDPPDHDAAWTFGSDGSFAYTPASDFVGTDTFRYCIAVGPDQPCAFPNHAPITVSIEVVAPIAVNDAYTFTPSGHLLTLPAPSVLGNDLGVSANASFMLGELPPDFGLMTNGQQGMTYSSDPNGVFYVGTSVVTYCITAVPQTGPCLSNEASIIVDSHYAIVDDDAYSTTSGTALAVGAPGLAANDRHIPTLSPAVIADAPSHAAAFDLHDDGTFTYTPSDGFVGVDTFTYCWKVVIEPVGQQDCAAAKDLSPAMGTVTINVHPTDDFVGVVPTRALETRAVGQTGYSGGKPTAGQTIAVDLGASVPSDAKAVALNVTAVDALADGFVTVWACGSPRPATSNLNVGVSRTVANLVISGIGPDGKVCVYTQQAADIVVDIEGYFPSQSSYTAVGPQRVLETRAVGQTGFTGPTPTAGQTVVLDIAGSAAHVVPNTAEAVALNVTGVNAAGDGFVTAWPCDAPRPTASHLNLTPSETSANLVIAPVSADGKVCLFTQSGTDLVADVFGYLPAGSSFHPVTPTRVLETRFDGQTAYSGSRPAGGQTIHLDLASANVAVPATADGVVLNITGVEPDSDGFVTAWPCGAPRPTASNINLRHGHATPNAVIVAPGVDGTVCIYTQSSADLVADLSGWFP